MNTTSEAQEWPLSAAARQAHEILVEDEKLPHDGCHVRVLNFGNGFVVSAGDVNINLQTHIMQIPGFLQLRATTSKMVTRGISYAVSRDELSPEDLEYFLEASRGHGVGRDA